MITTALPEEALSELLALTAAPDLQERPGDLLVSPRMADDDDDDDDEEEDDER